MSNVNFPDLSNLTNTTGLEGFLSLPNNVYPFFWVWIMFGVWIILSLTFFFNEKSNKGKGNILSAMSVSSLIIIFLSLLGTAIGIISLSNFLYIFGIGILTIIVWLFNK